MPRGLKSKPHDLHVYFSDEDYEYLQRRWAETFSEHRLRFGVWVVRMAVVYTEQGEIAEQSKDNAVLVIHPKKGEAK